MYELVETSIKHLDRWISQNGWAGYDPYDLRGLSLFIKNNPSFFERVLIRITERIEPLFPYLLRKLFRVKKEVNPKAMGLFADAYLTLYRLTKNCSYMLKAKKTIKWLDKNFSTGYVGKCWGYPFDWQSRIFIPRGTPSGVVSAIVGNAYWNFYRLTRDSKYLLTCKSICDFFINDLNIDKISPDMICFSYTPLDNFHVHNANLFVAEFLIKVGKEISNDYFVNLGLKAVNYTLSEQNPDGSICYWGKDQDENCRLDHYHSGFEIRALYSIWKNINDNRIFNAVKRYYSFYLKNFFENKSIPKLTPKNKYPINIHACAEALLCNATLIYDFPEGKEYLSNATRWVIKNMQDKTGYFYYMLRKLRGIEIKIKIPYVRWGQAWMLKALSEVFKLKCK